MYKYALLLILAMSASSWPTTAGARSRPARGRYTSVVPSARTGYGNYAPSYGAYAADYESHAPDYGGHAHRYGDYAHRYGDYAHRYEDYAHRYGSYALPGFTDPNYAYPYSARYV